MVPMPTNVDLVGQLSRFMGSFARPNTLTCSFPGRGLGGGAQVLSGDPRRACPGTAAVWGRSTSAEASIEVVAQDLRPRGVAQLRHRLRLDLADPLPGHTVDLSDL